MNVCSNDGGTYNNKDLPDSSAVSRPSPRTYSLLTHLKAYRGEEYKEIIETNMLNDPVAGVQFGADSHQGQCGEEPGDSNKRWASILITSYGG